jgi:hypothetical protein
MRVIIIFRPGMSQRIRQIQMEDATFENSQSLVDKHILSILDRFLDCFHLALSPSPSTTVVPQTMVPSPAHIPWFDQDLELSVI